MVAFPPPPPTANTLSSRERSALVRSSRKLAKLLGDVPRVPDTPSPSASALDLTATPESAWNRRKPTHLPPLLNLSTTTVNAPDPGVSPAYHRLPHRNSVLSVLSNAPSTASGSSLSDAPTESSHRRAKLERLRRKLGDEVPATAVFPTTPRTAVPRGAHPATPTSSRQARARTRSIVRPHADDARSVTFSISSDESVHTFALTAGRVHTAKHVYRTGALPPVPPIPAHLVNATRRTGNDDGDDAGLVRPRQKMAAGSKIGGADFKAARRAKREGKALNGTAEPGELIEMVGFLH